MSKAFKPCQGKTVCQETETGCRVCGRSAAEIARTRELIASISEFALSMEYIDSENFIEYLANKSIKKIKHFQLNSSN